MASRTIHGRRVSRIVALAMLVASLGVAASLSRIGFSLEEDYGLGWLFQLRGQRPVPADAVIVRYDRDTFARLRALPSDQAAWPQPLRGCAAGQGGLDGTAAATSLDRLPRGFHACLVRELTRRGAAAIVFDISFRRDPTRETGVPTLAAALAEHGRVVLLERAWRSWPARFGRDRPARLVQADLLEGPHPELTAAAVATAPFLLPRTGNQVHQFWAFNPAVALPPQLPVRALEVLSLDAMERFSAAVGRPVPAGASPSEALGHAIASFRAGMSQLGPALETAAGLTAREGELLEALARVYRGPEGYYLNLYGPPGSFASESAANLLLPAPGLTAGPALLDLEGKVVFVGYAELDMPQASDSFPTAFSGDGVDLSGVEIAATAFANLLRDESVAALPEWARTLLVGLLGAAMVLASCLGRVWRGLASTLALAAAYAACAGAAFVVGHFWLPIVVPMLLLLPLAIGLGQLVHYLGAARWLTIYTPRSVGQHLLEGRELETGRSQRCQVTVLLTDIAGFTSLAERSSPEAMTEFVNRHFTMLTACVEREAGVVAQFVGDGLMAFWGAPDPQPDHAARACRAALAIEAAIAADNRRRVAFGEPPVRIRVGINTGEVTAGNIGAPGRSSYGIVGDTVNTTQRIEQLGKVLLPDQPAAAILISSVTRLQAGDAFRFADAGVHLVRGRREAVGIFQLEGHAPRGDAVVLRVPPPRHLLGPPAEPDQDAPRRAAGGGHG